MWEEIIKLAVSNGLFAVLFCSLLVYQLKDSRTRENKYQKTISDLMDKFEVLNEIKQDNKRIREDNRKLMEDNGEIKRLLENGNVCKKQ